MMKPPRRKPSRGPQGPDRDRPRPVQEEGEEWQSRRPRKPRFQEERPAQERRQSRPAKGKPQRPTRPNRPSQSDRSAQSAQSARKPPAGRPAAPAGRPAAPRGGAARRRAVPKPNFAPGRSEVADARDIKEIWKPGTMLYPVPVVLVTSVGRDGLPNVCTVAWTGTVCSDPPMLSISLRPERLSHEYITQTRQFVVNIPSEALIRKTDFCGVVSGRDVDKIDQTGLTVAPASKVQAPLLLECPVNLECTVKKTLELGTHTMFVAEVVAVQVTKELIAQSGRLALEKVGLVAYVHGGYYPLGERLGKFGYSVRKKK